MRSPFLGTPTEEGNTSVVPSATSAIDNDESLIIVRIVAADDISWPSNGMGFWMIFLMSTDVYRVCSIG